MNLSVVRRWALFALPAAWVLLNTVTLRWAHVSTWDAQSPLFGLPLPWARWNMASSLHWNLAPLALLVDVLVYSVPFFLLGERLSVPKAVRVLVWLAAAFFVVVWSLGFFSGWHSFVGWFSTDQVTHVSVCLGPECYQTQ